MSRENVDVSAPARLSLHAGRAVERRTLDERVAVRFPALSRLLASYWSKLPRSSRTRRYMLARFIRRGYAAANSRDFDVMLLGFDPQIEFGGARDLLGPDQDPIAYGYEGYRESWRYWLAAFEDLWLEPEELLDIEGKVLVTIELRGHGSGSGVATSPRLFQLFHQRRGLVVRQQDFTDRAEALEAVGLRE